MAMPLRTPVIVETVPASVDRVLSDAINQVEPAELRDVLNGAVAGGKRIRPVLTALACAAAGGSEHDTLVAGAAIELLHASSLVHDDIMDAAELRRGNPTVMAHHGVPVAILAGDALVALSFRLIHSLDHPRKTEIQQVLTSAFLGLCEGQYADVTNTTGVYNHTWMVERKTARLIEACTRIGALIAGASAHQVQALGAFGLSLGLAYQATDDLLDATASVQETGKSVGQDSRNGRMTYLSLAWPDSDRVGSIRALVEAHTTSACEALEALPASPARGRLQALAQHLLDRRG